MNQSDHSLGRKVGKILYPESPTKKRYPRSPEPEKNIISPPTTTTMQFVYPDSPTKKRHSPRKPARPMNHPYTSPVAGPAGKVNNSKQFGGGLPMAPLSPGKKRYHPASPARRGRQTLPSSPYAPLQNKTKNMQRRFLRTLIVLVGVSLTFIPLALHSKVLDQSSAVVQDDAPLSSSGLRKTKTTKGAQSTNTNDTGKIELQKNGHDTARKKEPLEKRKKRQAKTKTNNFEPKHEHVKHQQHFEHPVSMHKTVKQSAAHIAAIHSRLQAAVTYHKQQENGAFLGSDGMLQAPTLNKKKPLPVKKIPVVRRTGAAHKSKFAYAYVLGGCNPADPSAYRGFLYNILLSVFLQHQEGSKADTIVFVQMANDSLHDTLPESDLELLHSQNNVYIEYIPNSTNDESFDQLMLNKFRILTLTQYDRVIYMDSDVMARGKLDYIMELSVAGTLRQNLVFAGNHVPATGAVFMVTPAQNDYERIQQIIAGGWDAQKGWGHAFEKHDSYELVSGQKKRNWDFQGASGDEGLLYHWAKYEKQSVSIVMKSKVQNWGGKAGSDIPTLQETLGLDVFVGHHHDCWAGEPGPCLAPFTTYYHFTGTTKPWLSDVPKGLANISNPTNFWFHMLSIVNTKFKLGIDFDQWKPHHRPLLGLHSTTLDVAKAVPDDSAARFAYAYVVGGCDPNKPAYRQFIYDILINTHLQREEGSKADVVVFFQMLNGSSYDTLPQEDLRLLNEMNIKIHYIPKSEDESFDQIMMEKFRILSLTQYERVLFMDSDVMVTGSFDYLFDLSVEGILKKNIIIAGRYAPASGDIFMISPQEGHWDRVLDIINDKENRGNKLPFPHWDFDKGWGHKFEDGDYYELIGGSKGSVWGFQGSSSDQGFLYNWVKYEERSVSIIMLDSVQNWDVGTNGKIQLEDTMQLDIFDGLFVEHKCWKAHLGHKPCTAPHNGYVHFSGGKKPWLQMPPRNFASKADAFKSAEQFWFYTMSVVNTKLNIGLDFKQWNHKERPLLGMHPNNIDGVASVHETAHSKNSTSKFAYAYVVGGCDPDDDAYRGFINAILVNTYLMREEGSKADVVIFIQMSFASPHSSLPEKDLHVLESMDIKIEYIPETEDESFERLMLDKFRILGLTQYERVLYLDSDVMVRGSMDYIFQLSMEGSIKENLVLSGRVEPAIGTIFMVAPKPGDWDSLLDVIRDKEERGQWDEVLGWGHELEVGEEYEMINGKRKNKWDFSGASADQGLLFHWVRFVKKSLTIVMKDTVQNWGAGKDGRVKLEKTFDIDVFTSLTKKRECWEGTLSHKPCTAPHSDWIHFPGLKKPWLRGPPDDFSEETAFSSPTHYWFHTLSILNRKLDLGLKFHRWTKHHRPLLGVFGTERLEGTAYAVKTSTELVAGTPYSQVWNSTVPRRFAYAYVIGGCKPEDPSYRNYFNDIMISTYVQREDGSQADVVVFVQMAYKSKHDKLPEEDLRLLNAMDIKMEYIPKAEDESFYRIMLDKFLILGLTQYERVLFMDGDVLARGSMDYIFELSVKGILKENVVTAGQTEPANGGFFMITPKEGSRDRVMNIIKNKEERGATLPYPHWDEDLGWGQPFEDGDFYELINQKRAAKWDFYGSFADQGLLYHWTKYEEKSVSIVFKKNVQNWGVGSDGKLHLEKELDLNAVFRDYSKGRKCWKGVMKFKPCKAPHSDFIHFTGRGKPWLTGPPDDFGEVPEDTSAAHYWYHILNILNEKLQIGLDFKNWKKHHRPFLGMYPQHKDVAKTQYASRKAK